VPGVDDDVTLVRRDRERIDVPDLTVGCRALV
jgi:hypothetical protein